MSAPCQFKSGDIIEWTEGRDESWATTTRLLIVCLRNKTDVCAVVLKEWHPVTKTIREKRHSDMGGWVLTDRKWVKVGEIDALSGVDAAVSAARRAWE